MDIEPAQITAYGGRPPKADLYPFAELAVTEHGHTGGIGPSFLIAEEDEPKRVLATARKRYSDKKYLTRRVEGGVRVWRIR